jgi:hypothetical protein
MNRKPRGYIGRMVVTGSTSITVQLDRKTFEEVHALSKKLDCPVTQFVAEAVKNRIDGTLQR